MRPRALLLPIVVALAAALSGCAGAASVDAPAADSPAAAAAPTATPAAAAALAAGAAQDPLLGDAPARSALIPTRVLIPSIGVDANLELLSRDDTGWIQPPAIVDEAGWYQDGVVPGETGPAVIAGHVDSRIGPGVFLDLASLQPGAEVSVTLSDGSSVAFVVTRSISVPKEQFPTDEVYGPTPTSQLRLITCGGVFDDAYGHYVDNVVVYASKVG
ncbi:class F sortase [Microbacteriaceae bacterium VKM Ac-2854]|nr:class F sortase [Microbacteriaceae bacterium VKM Ac-2854]